MRVSIGTAHVLGLKNIKTDTLPTTAYLMHGEGCRRNCQFCAQAVESKADSQMLSRVVWPKYDLAAVAEGLREAAEHGTLKRSCIQTVDDGDEATMQEEIRALVGAGLPLCVSKSMRSIEEIGELLGLGVDRVTIALDAMNPEIYREVKGGSFAERKRFLLEAASAFPGQIGTHLIVGLGETEAEAVQLMVELAAHGVHVALFAFTPVRGTALADLPQPEEETYRRIQIAHYLIFTKGYRLVDFRLNGEWLAGFTRPKEEVLALLKDGTAFRTSGCADCNRPYYNERPGGVIYNYPRPLTTEETYDCLKVAKLWQGVEVYSALRGE